MKQSSQQITICCHFLFRKSKLMPNLTSDNSCLTTTSCTTTVQTNPRPPRVPLYNEIIPVSLGLGICTIGKLVNLIQSQIYFTFYLEVQDLIILLQYDLLHFKCIILRISSASQSKEFEKIRIVLYTQEDGVNQTLSENPREFCPWQRTLLEVHLIKS